MENQTVSNSMESLQSDEKPIPTESRRREELSVLVVEPSRCQRLLLAARLESLGYRIFPVADARAGKAVLEQEHIDVALLEWELPAPGTLALVRGWHRDTRNARLAIFILDTGVRPERVAAARDAGAVDLLEKALPLESLRDRLEPWSSTRKQKSSQTREGALIPARLRDRSALMRRIEEELERATGPLSLLLLKLDDLLDIKIDLGRQYASQLMSEALDLVDSQVEGIDFVARHTGSEIAVLLPETDEKQAAVLLHRIRDSIDSRAWGQGNHAGNLGLSWGLATLEPSAASRPIDLVSDCVRSMLERYDSI